MPQAKVTSALERLRGDRDGREGRRDELVAALAQELDLTTAKVRSALDSVRGTRRHGADRAALARALGVSEAKLSDAIAAVRPALRDARGDGRAAELAKLLDLDVAKVRTTLEQLRDDHEAEHTERRKALATTLASRLKLDEAKVSAALEAEGFGFGRPGPRGGRGHRGPGGFGFGGP